MFEKLLIVNGGAGSVNDELIERLRREFPDYELEDDPFDPGFADRLAPDGATVVACGGDGTVGAVARTLAGTKHALGILAMGTFNNFARALGLPTDLDQAIEVVKTGQARPCTVGSVNGKRFLEAAAIGFFGETIALGEAAKDLHFGELGERLRTLTKARRFNFRTEGDRRLRGKALSLVIANTPSIGARLPVSDTSPTEPDLELVIDPGPTLLFFRRRRSYAVRRLKVTTDIEVSVFADASAAGSTPAEVETVKGGVRVILPK